MTEFPTFRDREGNHAIDENIRSSSSHGFSISNGCEVEVETGDLSESGDVTDTVSVTEGSVLVDGEHFQVPENTTVTLETAQNFPRWDVIYVDTAGTVQVAQGDEEPREPPESERTAVKRPAPPDMSEVIGTVLAICWVRASTDFLGADDIIDRRTEGDHILHRVRATGMLQRQSIPQGEQLYVPEDHVLDMTPPYRIDGTLELDGTLDLN